MKKILTLMSVLTLLLPTITFSKEEKPVEAWIEKKVINGKKVEVIKIKTSSGKIVEITPTLTKEEIPRPVSKLPEKTTRKLLYISLGLFIGLIAGIIIVKLLS